MHRRSPRRASASAVEATAAVAEGEEAARCGAICMTSGQSLGARGGLMVRRLREIAARLVARPVQHAATATGACSAIGSRSLRARTAGRAARMRTVMRRRRARADSEARATRAAATATWMAGVSLSQHHAGSEAKGGDDGRGATLCQKHRLSSPRCTSVRRSCGVHATGAARVAQLLLLLCRRLRMGGQLRRLCREA